MGSLDKGLWPPNTPITPRVDELNVTSQPISKSVQTYLLRTNSDHGPVSKDLLFFKFASDVSGAELLRLNYMKQVNGERTSTTSIGEASILLAISSVINSPDSI